MNSYSRVKVKASGVVVWASLVVGVVGYWITSRYPILEGALVIIGSNFIVFGRDLAIYQVEKCRFNYWFVRIGYLVGGIAIVVAVIVSWK